jgi:hypothetical protein
LAAPPQIRREEAEAALLELEVEKLAGEIARQSLEERLLEARVEAERVEVDRRRAEAASLDSARFRGDVFLIVFLLMVVLVLALAVVDPKTLGEIGRALPWRPY